MITNEERLNLEARIKDLEESYRVKNQKFDQLCKDFDARDAELKRIIAIQWSGLGESAHMLKTKNLEIERLKSQVPALRACGPIGPPAQINPTEWPKWGIEETDAEWAERAGRQIVEVTE